MNGSLPHLELILRMKLENDDDDYNKELFKCSFLVPYILMTMNAIQIKPACFKAGQPSLLPVLFWLSFSIQVSPVLLPTPG